MDPDLIVILVLLLFSGFFSASETALMSVTPAKVRTLVDSKKNGSRILAKLKEQHHRTLITILVGNNFVNIAAASMTTLYVTEQFNSHMVGLATGILTLVVLIFGEIIPKSMATNYAKPIALLFAPPLYALSVVLSPIIWLLDKFVSIIIRLLGAQEDHVTDEELIAMASIGEEQGSIDEHERELIENVLEFNDIKVEEIMTPRVHMDAMPEDYTLHEASQFVINHTRSRLPIYRDSVDHIVGILSIKTLVKALHEEEEKETTLRQIDLHKPLKVPAKLSIQKLFHQFKTKKTHMAIVMDEHGGVAGLITLEDLLEELVGDIQDEADEEEDNIKEVKNGVYELSGLTELWELSELTGLEFEWPDHKTIGFLFSEKLGHLPHTGQKINVENWQLKVTQMMRHTILKVELRKKTKKKKA